MSRFDRAVQVSEIIGALAVVISLLYVGSEIQQNTAATKLGMHQSSIAMGADWEDRLFEADFAEIYESGINDCSALSAADKLKFEKYVNQGLNIWEFARYSHDTGMMDDEIWGGWDGFFRSEINQESWQEIWRLVRHGYGKSFQEYVDDLTKSR